MIGKFDLRITSHIACETRFVALVPKKTCVSHVCNSQCRASCTPSAQRARGRPARRCPPGSSFRSNVRACYMPGPSQTLCLDHCHDVRFVEVSLKFKIVSTVLARIQRLAVVFKNFSKPPFSVTF